MSTTRLLSLLLASAMSFPLTAQTAEEAQRLHTQGRECFNSGRIAEGRALTKRAVDMRRQLFGEHHADYITSLNNYALSFEMEKNYGEAIRLQRRVMELCDSLNPPHPNWGLYTLNYGRFLYCDGKNRKRQGYGKKPSEGWRSSASRMNTCSMHSPLYIPRPTT